MDNESALTIKMKLWRVLLVLFVATLLAACSKSKNSDTTSAPGAPSANWDSIVWDQGNWS